MQLTLLESDRSFLRSAEWAALSILAHAGLVWLALGLTVGGRRFPTDEREARVFFLLPPDRIDAPPRAMAGALGGPRPSPAGRPSGPAPGANCPTVRRLP